MEKLNSILSKFQIPELAYEIETISNGFINDTFLVSNKDEPLYIIQRINTKVFTNTNSLIQNLELLFDKKESLTTLISFSIISPNSETFTM